MWAADLERDLWFSMAFIGRLGLKLVHVVLLLSCVRQTTKKTSMTRFDRDEGCKGG